MVFLKQLTVSVTLFFKFIRVSWQILYGAWRIGKAPQPVITIFGGARFDQTNFYAQQAHELAQKFVRNDISVLTGGGPGIMEAASCAIEGITIGHGKSIGIGVKDLEETGPNRCVQEYFELDYFFARKWLLTQYSVGFLIFPGGFGTLDELAEVLTLVKTHKLTRVPIILIGQEFWQPLMQWVLDEALKHGTIAQKEVDLLQVTDDLEHAFQVIVQACKFQKDIV